MASIIYDDTELHLEYYQFLQEKKAEGIKLIGYIAHEFIPEELIASLGAFPVPLIMAGDEERTTIGADYLTPSMCPFALSQIGAFEQKNESRNFRYLNLLDGIIATNYCAADFLVNEWISDLNEIKLFHLHIPYLKRDHHIGFYRSELAKLIKELEIFTGNTFDPQRFVETALKWIAIRKDLLAVNEKGIIGSEFLKIIQQIRLFGPEGPDGYNGTQGTTRIFQEDIKYLLNNLQPKEKLKSPSVILIGASAFVGDNLMELIEECGGNVLIDNTWLGNLSIYQKEFHALEKLGTNPTPDLILDFLTNRFRDNNISLHCTNEKDALGEYIENIEKLAKKSNTNAVINHMIKFCDITGHHRHEIKERLVKKGFHVLNLERDYSRSMKGQLKTRIEAFIEMIVD
jgi:benzoyl-CoA reductase/2-hydroxyglutaryl-CoA dehydratase subunit BcrC/BadD/HgdB